MNTPIRKKLTALDLGQECLADACADWREQPRTALVGALEKAPPELAADITLAAALAVVDAELRASDCDSPARIALAEISLGLSDVGRCLDAWHHSRAQCWEQRG